MATSTRTAKRQKLDNVKDEESYRIHADKLATGVAKLFDVKSATNKLTDVQIKVGTETFHCHKLVLQLNSDFFEKSVFESGIETVQDITSDHFYSVLQFMYTGEVLLSTNNIESILAATDNLGMDDLREVCLSFAQNHVNINNALLYWRLAIKYTQTELAGKCKIQVIKDLNQLNLVSSLMNATQEMIKLILSDDNLDVKSEVEVCEMLMKWLQVHTEVGHEVHPDQLLPLIRWSGISIDYVKSKLLQNKILTSNPASITFMSKVMTYLQSDAQFKGLKTDHRPSTGLQNCLMTIEPGDSGVLSISLQYPEKVTSLTNIPTMWSSGYATCSIDNKVYIAGVGASNKETWLLDTVSSWTQQASGQWIRYTDTARWIKTTDMLTGRKQHGAVIADSMLYVLGGIGSNPDVNVNAKTFIQSSVERYNTITNKWSSVGHLIHAVKHPACVTYENLIYVFGGEDENDEPTVHVQVFNPVQQTCTLMDEPIPRAYRKMRIVLWDTYAILLGRNTCFLYNFGTQTWQEREQFKTDWDDFALTVDNSIVYITGGTHGRAEKKKNQLGLVFTCNEPQIFINMRRLSVLDIIEDKPAVWTNHATTRSRTSGLIHAYVNIALP